MFRVGAGLVKGSRASLTTSLLRSPATANRNPWLNHGWCQISASPPESEGILSLVHYCQSFNESLHRSSPNGTLPRAMRCACTPPRQSKYRSMVHFGNWFLIRRQHFLDERFKILVPPRWMPVFRLIPLLLFLRYAGSPSLRELLLLDECLWLDLVLQLPWLFHSVLFLSLRIDKTPPKIFSLTQGTISHLL